MKVSKKMAARAALIAGLEAQVASLTVASQPTYGRSLWVEARTALVAAKAALAAMPTPPTKEEMEAAKATRLATEAAAKAERAAMHAARVAATKCRREALVCIKTCLARKAKAVAQAQAWVSVLVERANVFFLHAAADQENFGVAAEMAAARRNRAEKDLETLVATSAAAFWK